MDKWVEKHVEELRSGRDGRTEAWVQRQHKINFMMWIKQQGIPLYVESDESRLPSGPSSQITSWQGYDINGYKFHMKEKGIDEATGNTKTYYGQIEEIWELDYGSELQIPISPVRVGQVECHCCGRVWANHRGAWKCLLQR